MRLYRLWAYIAGLLILASSVNAQVPLKPFVQAIRTQDSVGLSDNTPMISQYMPPKVYAKWLVEIASCEELPLPTEDQLSKVRFFQVNARNFQINNNTKSTPNAIVDPIISVVYVSIVSILDEQIIKHEFLHLLLLWKDPKYDGEHDGEYWSKCGVDN